MKTAVYHGPGKIELEDWPVPEAGSDGIVVKVKVSMVCGTDVKTFKRGHPMFKPPTVLGHEFSGEVVAVGGERVVCKRRRPRDSGTLHQRQRVFLL